MTAPVSPQPLTHPAKRQVDGVVAVLRRTAASRGGAKADTGSGPPTERKRAMFYRPPTPAVRRGRQGHAGNGRHLSGVGIAVLIVCVFMPQVDYFIVNVALPTIDRSLHASPSALELVVAGYGTAYAALLVVGGRLGDMVGRRRVLSIGLSGFTAASLGCGLAPSVWFCSVPVWCRAPPRP
jgi:hypothetical protein